MSFDASTLFTFMGLSNIYLLIIRAYKTDHNAYRHIIHKNNVVMMNMQTHTYKIEYRPIGGQMMSQNVQVNHDIVHVLYLLQNYKRYVLSYYSQTRHVLNYFAKMLFFLLSSTCEEHSKTTDVITRIQASW